MKQRKLNKSVKEFMEECLKSNDLGHGDSNSCHSRKAFSHSRSGPDKLTMSSNPIKLSSRFNFQPNCIDKNEISIDNEESDAILWQQSSILDNCVWEDDIPVLEPTKDSIDGEYHKDDNNFNPEENSIYEHLAEWTVKYKISLAALAALLVILNCYSIFSALPKDPRTLLSTPQKYLIQNLAGGSYYYRGIKNGLNSMMSCRLPDTSKLNLQVNVDGLPLFQSNNMQLWPILGLVNELKELGPFVIALLLHINLC